MAERFRKLEGIAVAQNSDTVGSLVRHRKRRCKPSWFLLKERLQIVHFHQSIAGAVVRTAYDRGVVSRWQRSNDCGLAWLSRSMPAVLDCANLVGGDDSADYRSLPVVIRGNQRSRAIVQV